MNTTEEEKFFFKTGQKLEEAEQGQMFGKPCFKINGKVFICFFKECMVFKLDEKSRKRALDLHGTQLFDPSGKNRPMKEWIQVPFIYKNLWKEFTSAAAEYVIKGR